MKKYLVIIALLFTGLLAVVTSVFYKVSVKPSGVDTGNFAVALNEIEQLCADGNSAQAQDCAEKLRLSLSDYVYEENAPDIYMWAVFAVSAVCITAVFVYIWFAVLRPFEKLMDFAEKIAGGDFDFPLDFERTNYFGKFTWAFDCMRREISSARACEKEAIENNKTVIASLSHDIRTPVASIRAYAEGLEAGLDNNAEKRAKFLGVIMRKCDEISSLTNDMLLHSASDLDKLKMNPSEFELCSFIKETVSEISVLKNIRLCLPSYCIDITADRNRLVQVFENIISNATKYAKTDIEISALKTEKSAEICFRDFGKGVLEEEIPFIFDKFYRGSRIERENGAGLGLHIVKYIVTSSGGEVYAENLPDGFCIKINLPLRTS